MIKYKIYFADLKIVSLILLFVFSLLGTDLQNARAEHYADTFDDNVKGDEWCLSESSPGTLEENNSRLEFTTAGSDGGGDYVLCGKVLNTNRNFSCEVDWHLSKDSGAGTFAVSLGLVVPSVHEDILIGASYDDGSLFFHCYGIDGGIDYTISRAATDGVVYISYDANQDKLYLSINGYWLIENQAAGNWVVQGLLQGAWADKSVSAYLEADVEDSEAIEVGDAWFDNFEINYSPIAPEAVWPMQVGQDWVYEANESPSGNAMADIHFFISEEVTFDSQQYFHVSDSYFRSTDEKIYEWESGGETLFFQTAPVGTTWRHSTDNTVEILDDNFPVNIAYGSKNYSAYKLQFSDPDGSWNIYVVPNLGLVQLDQFDEDPSHIMKLKDISSERPIDPGCESAKIKAASTLCKSLANCCSKDIKKPNVDKLIACEEKSYAKFENSWTKTDVKEAKKGRNCDTDDAKNFITSIDDGGIYLIYQEIEANANTETKDGRTLAASLLKAAGTYCSSIFKAESANAKKDNPEKLSSSLTKAGEKFQKSWDKAIAKAGKKEVIYAGDIGAVTDIIDDMVNDVLDGLQ